MLTFNKLFEVNLEITVVQQCFVRIQLLRTWSIIDISYVWNICKIGTFGFLNADLDLLFNHRFIKKE